MEEDLISFETAKLAKEKGFNHLKSNCFGDNMCYQLPNGELINALKGNIVAGYILAPTQALLQKWLRKKHNIFVFLDVNHGFYVVKICKNKLYNPIDYGENYESPEEALEEGLYQALKLIK